MPHPMIYPVTATLDTPVYCPTCKKSPRLNMKESEHDSNIWVSVSHCQWSTGEFADAPIEAVVAWEHLAISVLERQRKA